MHKKWALQDGVPYNDADIESEYESEDDAGNMENISDHDSYWIILIQIHWSINSSNQRTKLTIKY